MDTVVGARRRKETLLGFWLVMTLGSSHLMYIAWTTFVTFIGTGWGDHRPSAGNAPQFDFYFVFGTRQVTGSLWVEW
ncbi:hypothetical protein LX32DRAFT_258608 [Colletotrichum zoysiae]|uniref:Uncharacterized protein n=1 Tax=Colletotrichum zoysiae TaxID=1216348 RepID=A0AAD9LX22_9PEZI|nr:hypothetical protein LX32DRAFT_258608 [Colletotrichum zoysiae]